MALDHPMSMPSPASPVAPSTVNERSSPLSNVVGPQTLGETLRLLRHRARTSRDQLAGRAGVSTGAISNYENDISLPPAPTLRRLCRVLAELLGQSTDDLWRQIGTLLDQFGERDGRR